MRKRVVVTGMGAISPVGLNAKDTWENLLKGKSGISAIEDEAFIDFSTRIAGQIKDFNATEMGLNPKDARRMARFIQFALVAAKEAVEDAGMDVEADADEVGVLIGSGVGGIDILEQQAKTLLEKGVRKVSPFTVPMMIANMAAGLVSIQHGAKGPNLCTVTACASGTHSLGDAYKIIQEGSAVAMIAGGAEAAITPLGMAGFVAAKSLSTRNEEPTLSSRPFEKDRDGFVMGEGAAVLILEELEHAKKRGAKIYAEVCGYGMSGDAYHMTAPPEGGAGGARAISRALKDAGLDPKDIDYVNAHGTSTQLNDKEETAAIKSVFGDHAKKLLVSSTKSMTGHLLGAAGALEGMIIAKVLQTGDVPPTINYDTPDEGLDLNYVPNKAVKAEVKNAISNSFGFGGHNAVIAMKAYS